MRSLFVIGPIGMALILIAPVRSGQSQQRQTTAGSQGRSFTYVIDSKIQPSGPIEARSGEPAPRIATMFDPKGNQHDFVVDELIVKPRSNSELRELLKTYNARVVDDGSIPALPPRARPRGVSISKPRKTGSVVIKVDLTRAPLSGFVSNARRLKLTGEFRYSSEDAARLGAIIVQERVRGRKVGLDVLLQPQSTRLPCQAKTTLEHASVASAPDVNRTNLGYLDAAASRWLKDPGIQVVDAWDLLERSGRANNKVLLFVIDGGFFPNNDFRSTAYQYDFIHNIYDAVSPNPMNCGAPCPWHGTQVFGVAGALINNRFGWAGTGGQVAEPVLFRVKRLSEEARAVRSAILWTRDLRLPAVINMSFGAHCGWFCYAHGLDDALKEAAGKGIIPVAAAGNDNEDAEDNDVIPCKEPGVICVGAIGTDKKRASFSNYGSTVDIWAPGEDVVSTTTPDTGDAPGVRLPRLNGTSVASPFVAGIVAMMKAIDRSLSRDQVRYILRQNTTPSSDPQVKPGYVNALTAVSYTLRNLTPNRATRFVSTGVKWHDGFGYRNEFVSVGDFNGDCRDDIITFTKGNAGEVFVALSSGTDFVGTGWRWGQGICVRDQVCAIGDFNHDRLDDIAVIDQDTGSVQVALSTGSSFDAPTEWLSGFSIRHRQTVLVGNFGYDGADDLALFVHGNDPTTLAPGETRGQVYVALSDGKKFMQRYPWHQFFAPGPEKVAAGDFSMDGFNDIVAFLQDCCPQPAQGDVFVALSAGNYPQFWSSTKWHNFFSPGTEVPAVGDFNGDGRSDVLSFVRSSSTGVPGIVKVGLSGRSNTIELVGVWNRSFCYGAQICLTGDFNGDRRSDIAAFTMGDLGDVYVALSAL